MFNLNISFVKASIRYLIYATLIYIAGYESRNDDEIPDAYCYCEIYRNYCENNMNRGGLKIHGDIIICQLASYSFIS